MSDDPTEEAFAKLSDKTKAVAGAWFGAMRPDEGSHLTFHMVESKPSPQAQECLDELTAAGLIKTIGIYRPPAISYTPTISMGIALGWLWQNRDRPDLKFPLTIPVEPGSKRKRKAQIEVRSG